jgi:hypothetical protein
MADGKAKEYTQKDMIDDWPSFEDRYKPTSVGKIN